MLASNLFNGYIGSNLCYHLEKEGIFELFGSNSSFDKSILKEKNFDNRKIKIIESLISFSTKFGFFVDSDEGKISLTPLGMDMRKNVGFFTWSIGGYGNFMRNFTDLKDEKNNSLYSLIDGANVALGSRQANREYMWNTIIKELKRLNISKIVDLGCGAAGALIDICKIFNKVTGLGIDISHKAIEAAEINIRNNSMDDRICVVNQNVMEATDDASLIATFETVDTVISFMMLHDLFSIKDPVDVLRTLQKTFPKAKRFLLADTFMSDENTITKETPIFTYGFEFVHHFMNIRIYKKEEYIDFFSKAGFEIEKIQYLNVPNTYLFTLK
ncbi:class I SAM-dependent methyltransferase [Photorhabdus bodei]|uniref:Methyltransferase domain-containing protein n=1 Tax=Photorhabdus bodei TaxID=2029681 RepID=A0A329XA51_9GAMM|nr:class I SAM-dependent methyltransferase [Photorhabdus bodei]NDK98377.1 methyltransferase domain-containing protein [Photorhabdus bodei]NDL02625.1 methyltransferase domain-containing protein [Photorhabdus bodei]NDL06888.1 methyltransferase domain-containing protein [Photorhabdus bodei]RAX13466.1 hypothetical protein CKY02_06625 [Photorhabdus bodei]